MRQGLDEASLQHRAFTHCKVERRKCGLKTRNLVPGGMPFRCGAMAQPGKASGKNNEKRQRVRDYVQQFAIFLDHGDDPWS